MAIDRSPLQPSIDCVKHIYSTVNGAGSYQSLHSEPYHSNRIPCLITETSGPTLVLMTFIDKSNSEANLGRCGLMLRMREYVCVCADLCFMCVSVTCQSASRFMRIVTLSPPPLGILMKRRPLQTCSACPTTARADSGENFDINDLCHICIQT